MIATHEEKQANITVNTDTGDESPHDEGTDNTSSWALCTESLSESTSGVRMLESGDVSQLSLNSYTDCLNIAWLAGYWKRSCTLVEENEDTRESGWC
jgi:hypothetical protein